MFVIVLDFSVFDIRMTDSIGLIYVFSSQLHKPFQVLETQFHPVNILGCLDIYFLTQWQDSIE